MNDARRPVGFFNPFGYTYHVASNAMYGNIAPYTGYPGFKGPGGFIY